MEAPSIHTYAADLEQNLRELINQIHAVRGERWLARSGISHGKFMAERRERLKTIGTLLGADMAELIDLWPFMQATPEQRARHELLMRTAIRWMATCDVDMTVPWFRAYRQHPHRLVDRGRAYVSYFRGRLSFFGDDGTRDMTA